MSRWRVALLVVALLLVGLATLTPGNVVDTVTASPKFFCLACGPLAGADMTVNVMLFVPLGLALMLLQGSPLRAVALGAAISVAIECAQHFGFPPARVANITDIGANALGTLLGALAGLYRSALMHPSPRRAAGFLVTYAVFVAVLLAFTAWALELDVRSHNTGDIHRSEAPFIPGFGWFHGRVLSVRFNDAAFSQSGDGPLVLRGTLGQRTFVAARVAGRDDRTGVVPFLYLHEMDDDVPELMLSEKDRSAQLSVAMRARRMKLAYPALILVNGFADTSATRVFVAQVQPGLLRLEAGPDSVVAAQFAGTHLTAILPLTLSLGWTLFQTVVQSGEAGSAVAAHAWLLLICLPLGYWLMLAGRRFSVAACGALALVAGALCFSPALFSISNTPLVAWFDAAAGVSLGVIGAVFSRRRVS